jgi:hypothetical protein
MKQLLAFKGVMLFSVLLIAACNRTAPKSTAALPEPLCECGPDVCLNDPRYPPKLAKKKADLRAAGYPDELIALLDRDGKCVMAVDQAPDGFRILLVKANGDNNSIPWTKEDEDLAKKEILNGTIKEYYKHNVRKVLACCKEPKAEERPDWDSALSLSRSLSIVCSKQGSSVVCK